VLRFWETRFPQIRPMKRGGGRRYYRPDDVELLRGIRHLLYGEGYTIRGVQRILKTEGLKFVQGVWKQGAPQPERKSDDGEAPPTAEVLPVVSPGSARAPDGGAADKVDEDEDADEAEDAEADGGASDEAPAVEAAPARAEAPVVVARTPPRSQATPTISRPTVAQPPAAAPLSDEQKERLRAVLAELNECRRILDSVLKDSD
jgi:DNA-binding transcriptional MerR regulator